MPPSKWVAQHKGCQKAVDNVRADLGKEIERLEGALRRASDDLPSIIARLDFGRNPIITEREREVALAEVSDALRNLYAERRQPVPLPAATEE